MISKLSKTDHKVVNNDKKLQTIVKALRDLGYSIVVTIGSWDMLHIGHVRYLNKAKESGDVLVVGVDSDRAIKLYKNPLRPIIPESEREEMLSYQSCVDLVTIVDDINAQGQWSYGLIKLLKPEVFIAVEDSYPKKQLAEIKRHVGKLIVLPRQAQNTSTSKVIQKTIKAHVEDLIQKIGT